MSDAPELDPILPVPDVLDPASPDAPAGADAGSADQIATLTRERDEHYDRLLRKTAEFENYRRRVERERREQADQAVVAILEDLLSVLDDFDLALKVEAGDGASSYRKGIELIHGKLNDVLRKAGVSPFDSVGQDFDPNVHQAVLHEESPGHRDGEVVMELRRGYKMGDRLLRPAMVKVAKA